MSYLSIVGALLSPAVKKAFDLASEELGRMWNVNEDIESLAKKLTFLQALLSDAQKKQLNSDVLRLWLKDIQSISVDAEIVLDDFGYEVIRRKVKKKQMLGECFPFNRFPFNREMSNKIKSVLSSLDQVCEEASKFGLHPVDLINTLPHVGAVRPTYPFIGDSERVGREDDVSKVIHMLIHSSYGYALPVVTILGMGGQGKTTLAKVVYNNHMVRENFDKTIWICVSDNFNIARLLGEILQSVSGINRQLTNAESLVNELQKHLRGQRYLLVLDDMWNKDKVQWEEMRNCLLDIGGSKESKILATTRSEEVAETMKTPDSDIHRVQPLSEDESRELFDKFAFAAGRAKKTPQLMEIGKRILKKCGGLPLAIKTIATTLSSKHFEHEWLTIEKSKWWNATQENSVLSVIKLSYDHLPSPSIKQCFAFCAIFEKDKILKKDELIQLWMAQGLLNTGEKSDLLMEDIGNVYFNILLRSSLFQDVEMDEDNNIWRCKMHDLVHDVALEVSKEQISHVVVVEGKPITKTIETLHVSLNAMENGWPISSESLKNLKSVLHRNLRTLYWKGPMSGTLFKDLSEEFERLTILIVHDAYVGEMKLPNSIGKMKHLRFLGLEVAQIDNLPESFSKLYYLQTLRVYKLDGIPKGFGNLINLRHLYIGSQDQRMENISPLDRLFDEILFPGIGRLTNLQTLSVFNVKRSEGCAIQELGNMNKLTGMLSIRHLENVGSRASAKMAKLWEKSRVQRLQLLWNREGGEEGGDDIEVLEGLKPHSNLKILGIKGYQGQKFASWMVAKEYPSAVLHNLKILKLQDLDKCENLPTLGRLPYLENLYLRNMGSIKRIGEEFYGWSNDDLGTRSSTPGSSSSNGSVITLFPALRIFDLDQLDSLREWFDVMGAFQSHNSSSSVQVKVFPHLEELHMMNVPCILPNLGDRPSLRVLRIWGLKDTPISSSFNPAQPRFPSLVVLGINECGETTEALCDLIPSSTPLQDLDISAGIKTWPKDLHHLTRLQNLTLRDSVWIEDDEDEEDDCLPWPYPYICDDATSHPPPVSLTSLTLDGASKYPNVTHLPAQIQYVTTLEHLEIRGFVGLESLPEWLRNLHRLQRFLLRGCENLKQLPSAEAIGRLTNLRYLTIIDCPILKERCREESGSEWPKIAHIPSLRII
ncbi:OLC1v1039158C2 [Oldenlandia corymbosa var. corymbosa]|nr:OLC1v1039158C2 [Oldenlandia corymbosa var. corymbosa]